MADRVDFRMLSADGRSLACYEWPVDNPRAVVLIVHGMAEHAARYGRFAQALGDRGFAAVAMDLRGHGRTAAGAAKGFFAAKAGWQTVLGDLQQLTRWAQTRYDRPVLLLGHSMGSIFARLMLQGFGESFRAAALSGVTVDKPIRRDMAPLLTGLMCALQGPATPSKLLDDMVFGVWHKPFRAERPTFGWLSRDRAETQAYVDDPDCGFVCTASLFRDVAQALLRTLRADQVARMPRAVPVLLLSGSCDPAGEYGAAARELRRQYERAGLAVTCHVYEDARHELLNDTCRDEVTRDILDFFDTVLTPN